MNRTFRERVFVPLVLPIAVIGGILLFAISLSRVLLASPEAISTLIAVGVAGYVLLVASLVASRPTITGRALGAGLVLALAGVVGAGALASAAGMRELHHEEPAGEGGDDDAVEIPDDALVWAAEGTALEFSGAPSEATAGDLVIAIDNIEASSEHNVTFEGVDNDQPVVQAAGGSADVGEVTLEPGTYVYYCSVAGHREAGMEGELTVN